MNKRVLTPLLHYFCPNRSWLRSHSYSSEVRLKSRLSLVHARAFSVVRTSPTRTNYRPRPKFSTQCVGVFKVGTRHCKTTYQTTDVCLPSTLNIPTGRRMGYYSTLFIGLFMNVYTEESTFSRGSLPHFRTVPCPWPLEGWWGSSIGRPYRPNIQNCSTNLGNGSGFVHMWDYG